MAPDGGSTCGLEGRAGLCGKGGSMWRPPVPLESLPGSWGVRGTAAVGRCWLSTMVPVVRSALWLSSRDIAGRPHNIGGDAVLVLSMETVAGGKA